MCGSNPPPAAMKTNDELKDKLGCIGCVHCWMEGAGHFCHDGEIKKARGVKVLLVNLDCGEYGRTCKNWELSSYVATWNQKMEDVKND